MILGFTRSQIIMGLLLLVLILMILKSLRAASLNPRSQINLEDLLIDFETNRISKVAFVLMGSFALTSWMMVYLIMTKQMTEGYFLGYCGIWATPAVAKLFANPKPTMSTESISVERSTTAVPVPVVKTKAGDKK